MNQTKEVFQVDIFQVHRNRFSRVLRAVDSRILLRLRLLLSGQVHCRLRWYRARRLHCRAGRGQEIAFRTIHKPCGSNHGPVFGLDDRNVLLFCRRLRLVRGFDEYKIVGGFRTLVAGHCG